MAQIKVLKISSAGIPLEHTAASDDLTVLSLNAGNVQVSANAVISTDTDGDLSMTPDGTGDLILDGVKWPQADGSINQILSTDGSGQLSYVTAFAETLDSSYTADETLLIRDALYISAADNVSKAVGSGESTARLIGFGVAAAADTNSVTVRKNGVMVGFSGLTAGARQFLHPSSAGLITETIPVGTGNIIVQAGYAKSTTDLEIQIQQLGQRA